MSTISSLLAPSDPFRYQIFELDVWEFLLDKHGDESEGCHAHFEQVEVHRHIHIYTHTHILTYTYTNIHTYTHIHIVLLLFTPAYACTQHIHRWLWEDFFQLRQPHLSGFLLGKLLNLLFQNFTQNVWMHLRTAMTQN